MTTICQSTWMFLVITFLWVVGMLMLIWNTYSVSGPYDVFDGFPLMRTKPCRKSKHTFFNVRLWMQKVHIPTMNIFSFRRSAAVLTCRPQREADNEEAELSRGTTAARTTHGSVPPPLCSECELVDSLDKNHILLCTVIWIIVSSNQDHKSSWREHWYI